MSLELLVDDEFKEYLITKKLLPDDAHYMYLFDNGYGANIIKNRFSYGYSRDLWELALVAANEDGGLDVIDAEITNYDVLGYLTDSLVNYVLHKIKAGEVGRVLQHHSR